VLEFPAVFPTGEYVPVDVVERYTLYVIAVATASHVTSILLDDFASAETLVGAAGFGQALVVAEALLDFSLSPQSFLAITL
jgi:hypothetical protein